MSIFYANDDGFLKDGKFRSLCVSSYSVIGSAMHVV